jgi:hypothetical protein
MQIEKSAVRAVIAGPEHNRIRNDSRITFELNERFLWSYRHPSERHRTRTNRSAPIRSRSENRLHY